MELSRPFASFVTIKNCPVSAMPKLTPVIPMSASKNRFRSHARDAPISTFASAGKSLPSPVGFNTFAICSKFI